MSHWWKLKLCHCFLIFSFSEIFLSFEFVDKKFFSLNALSAARFENVTITENLPIKITEKWLQVELKRVKPRVERSLLTASQLCVKTSSMWSTWRPRWPVSWLKFKIKWNLMFLINLALAGCTAGILGLTGLLGFIFYLVSLLGFFGLLIVKTGSNWQKYFISRNSLLSNGFLGGLCTYTLFWTFIYGMVHVY